MAQYPTTGTTVEVDPVAEADLAAHAALHGKGSHVPAGGLPASDLAFDVATQAELDAATALLLPKAGGTMTGKITLDGDPTANLHPATRQYVAGQIAALINGAPAALDTLKEIADQLASDETAATALTGIVAGKLAAAANLADLVSAVTARTNLGLGTAATHPAGDFETAGSVAAEAAARAAADALLIPRSLVDVKGDLLVATADNVVDRVGAGADGQVLTADAAQAKGLKWAAAAGGGAVVSKKIGAYYTTPASPTNGWSTGSGDAVGTMALVPVRLEAGTLDRLAQQQFSAGAAGELMRLGLYADDGSGFPGALLVDGGTIDLSTGSGIKAVTIALGIARGMYFLASVRQGPGNTVAVLISGAGLNVPRALMPHGPTGGGNLYDGGYTWVQTGVAGALPANYTGNTQGNSGVSFAPAFARYGA